MIRLFVICDPLKHEEGAIYAVNLRIPNVFRIAGAALQRSNSLASLLPGSQLKNFHACMIRLFVICDPLKHEEGAIYAVNLRIPNVFRIAGAALQRSNSLASLLPGSQLKNFRACMIRLFVICDPLKHEPTKT